MKSKFIHLSFIRALGRATSLECPQQNLITFAPFQNRFFCFKLDNGLSGVAFDPQEQPDGIVSILELIKDQPLPELYIENGKLYTIAFKIPSPSERLPAKLPSPTPNNLESRLDNFVFDDCPIRFFEDFFCSKGIQFLIDTFDASWLFLKIIRVVSSARYLDHFTFRFHLVTYADRGAVLTFFDENNFQLRQFSFENVPFSFSALSFHLVDRMFLLDSEFNTIPHEK